MIVGLRVMYLIYLAIVTPYALLQARFAAAAMRRSGILDRLASTEPFLPSVDVVITCYNEDPALLDECCASVAGLDYAGPMRVSFVDDGSGDAEGLKEVLERYRPLGWVVLFSPVHDSKRAALNLAFERCDGDIMITVDSDTVLTADAVTRIVQPFRDPMVGAVCGNLRAKNADDNLLTALIDRRYELLFEQERAAQSRFGATQCCAGPFSGYRRSALLPAVWKRYLDQTFLGVRCTAGDDLHLTVEVLSEGFRTTFAPRALAYTQVPSSLGHYSRQQLRWQRSMFRELRWILPLLRRWHPYIILDVAARILLPFLLLAVTALFVGEVVLIDLAYLLLDWYLLAIPMLLTAALVVWQVRDLRFLAYGPLHLLLLIPSRMYAVLSVASSNWMTRNRR